MFRKDYEAFHVDGIEYAPTFPSSDSRVCQSFALPYIRRSCTRPQPFNSRERSYEAKAQVCSYYED
jgi:hypothetical protein